MAWSRSEKTVISVFRVRPRRIGGTEVFARELSEQLAAKGWRSVLCFTGAPSQRVRKFLEMPNVLLVDVPDMRDFNYRAASRILRLVLRYRPSVFHLHYVGLISLYSWAARLVGARHIFFTDQISPSDSPAVRRRPAWNRAVRRVALSPLQQIIAVSEFGRRSLIEHGFLSPDRVQMIYNSVDARRAAAGRSLGREFRERHGIAADRLVMVQVGQLIPEKGVQDLLRAARDVIAQEPRAHVVLVGDGPQDEKLREFARALGISSQVTFTGLVQDPVAEGVFAAADIACQMSRWQEVFGYTIAEALASGIPVIGTRVGGIPEVISDRISGYVVERGDTDAMAARMLELLRDPDLRARMGEAGRQSVAERFNHTRNVARLLEFYGI